VADDIVTRLRDQAEAPALAWLTEAADEIERLRVEINDLRLQVVALSIPKDTRRG
jgi:hypothetical protein